jgi:hypothetical protein
MSLPIIKITPNHGEIFMRVPITHARTSQDSAAVGKY